MIILLAGNRSQYDYWMQHTFMPGKCVIFADRPEKIRGIRADEIIITGTFWERFDAMELYNLASSRMNNKSIWKELILSDYIK